MAEQGPCFSCLPQEASEEGPWILIPRDRLGWVLRASRLSVDQGRVTKEWAEVNAVHEDTRQEVQRV